MSVKQFSQKKAIQRSRGTSFKVLTDRLGCSYRLFISSQGDRYSLKLYDGSLLAGEARCSWQDDGRMVLDDIAIANEASPVLNLLERLQQWLLGAEFERVNYRQRGLGTLLLCNLIEHARKLGASSIRGEVFQADVENNPKLLNWYGRHGFVQSAPQMDQADVLANISLELRSVGQLERLKVADSLS